MIFSSLSISYTNKCTAACAHCIVGAGPDKDEKLSPDLILPVLPDCNQLGIKNLLVTGGEPILYLDELESISSEVLKSGWHITIYSNGFWADNEKNAAIYAARFKKAGINSIVISTDRYHIDYIPFSIVQTAVDTLKAHDINCSVMYMKDNVLSAKDLYIDQHFQKNKVSNSIYRLSPDGRGEHLPEVKSNYIIPKKNMLLKRPCHLLQQLFINHDGNVLLCCTSSGRFKKLDSKDFYCFGNIKEDSFKTILNKIKAFFPIIKIIKQEGPAGIYHREKNELEKAGFSLKEYYYARCELCFDILGEQRYEEITKSLCR